MLVIATTHKPLALSTTNITSGGSWVIMEKFGNIGQCSPQIPVLEFMQLIGFWYTSGLGLLYSENSLSDEYDYQ